MDAQDLGQGSSLGRRESLLLGEAGMFLVARAEAKMFSDILIN